MNERKKLTQDEILEILEAQTAWEQEQTKSKQDLRTEQTK